MVDIHSVSPLGRMFGTGGWRTFPKGTRIDALGPARSGLVRMECGPQAVVKPAVGCVGSRTWFSDESSRLFAQCPSGVNAVVLFPSRIEEDAYGSILHGLQERPQGDVAHGLRNGGREAPAQRLFSRTRSGVEGLRFTNNGQWQSGRCTRAIGDRSYSVSRSIGLDWCM